jgi:hypothetical protein
MQTLASGGISASSEFMQLGKLLTLSKFLALFR